jgi:5-methylcytosine-specific restriction endonuclease McrA
VARGGHKGWDNIVTCCIACNRRKGDRTPEEAGLTLERKPRRPASLPSLTLSLGIQRTPESWRDYLFWDISWERG